MLSGAETVADPGHALYLMGGPHSLTARQRGWWKFARRKVQQRCWTSIRRGLRQITCIWRVTVELSAADVSRYIYTIATHYDAGQYYSAWLDFRLRIHNATHHDSGIYKYGGFVQTNFAPF